LFGVLVFEIPIVLTEETVPRFFLKRHGNINEKVSNIRVQVSEKCTENQSLNCIGSLMVWNFKYSQKYQENF
jgi:hypothetical protein